MASSAKDIQLRELKDTISQLKTMMSEQTELIKSLRLIIEEKSNHEKALQEQVDYLTKKLFGASSEATTIDVPGQMTFLMKLKWNRIFPFLKMKCPSKNIPARKIYTCRYV
jgi:uncharacterized coiled-coil protein SlyX